MGDWEGDILKSAYFLKTYRESFGSQMPGSGVIASRARENTRSGNIAQGSHTRSIPRTFDSGCSSA